ncbi:hypothetical protein [Halorussus pelagicus]|uniref:hypothetical protein n=1 Tax=Halorussus pelagicus TaxID=2505977 RepID=UPI000FFB841D|nr:hypothetical protein [Halorussus pelagicus]
MSHEIQSRYRVKDIVEAQGDVWLEDLDPERSGLLVAVEMNGEYDSDTERKIEHLTEGDTITATLESQNERHTVWHFSRIGEDSNDRSVGVRV